MSKKNTFLSKECVCARMGDLDLIFWTDLAEEDSVEVVT